MAKITLGKKIIENQVIRFVLSTGVGFLVDQSAFFLFYKNLFTSKIYILFSFVISNYFLSFSISFFLGVLVNFLIIRYFVFSESKTSSSKQFIRFFSVAIIGYFANLGLLELFVKEFQMYPPLARITAALSLFFASYFVHKLFSFSLSLRHHAPGKSSTAGN
ncbi:MAG TPA: GtrA family protein [Mucilaginibacter sp.]|jgi:putative flippase GtrA